MTLGFALGFVSPTAFWTFLLLAIGLGMMLSMSALLLEEISFHVYKRPSELAVLAAAALIENFGYRQLITVWRLHGFWQWVTGKGGGWGEMKRSASWQKSL